MGEVIGFPWCYKSRHNASGTLKQRGPFLFIFLDFLDGWNDTIRFFLSQLTGIVIVIGRSAVLFFWAFVKISESCFDCPRNMSLHEAGFGFGLEWVASLLGLKRIVFPWSWFESTGQCGLTNPAILNFNFWTVGAVALLGQGSELFVIVFAENVVV